MKGRLWSGCEPGSVPFDAPEEVIPAATRAPAAAPGAREESESLSEGKRADFIICDEDWRSRQVYNTLLNKNHNFFPDRSSLCRLQS